jgi:hypothetical protein
MRGEGYNATTELDLKVTALALGGIVPTNNGPLASDGIDYRITSVTPVPKTSPLFFGISARRVNHQG